MVKITSENLAKQNGVYDRKGSFTQGKDADILPVDNKLTIKYTICLDDIAFKGE
nr:amidohydrolase family protein [Oceanobacillus sp. AG]